MKTQNDQFSLAFSKSDCGYRLEASQWVPKPVEEVFAFFQQPANLAKLTPPKQKLRFVGHAPEVMEAGMIVSYRLQVVGIPLFWKARIEQVDPPHSFVDVMLSGPYRAWRHQHLFEPVEGGTRIRDVVDYKIYGCRYGHRFFFQPQLTKIFQGRRKAVNTLFVSGT